MSSVSAAALTEKRDGRAPLMWTHPPRHQPASLAGRIASKHDSDSYVVENARSFTTSHPKVSIDTIVQWTAHRPSVQIESGGDGHRCARHRTEELGISEITVKVHKASDAEDGRLPPHLHTAPQYAARERLREVVP